MLEGLFIRRIFVLVDFVLTCAVVAVICLVGMKIFETPQNPIAIQREDASHLEMATLLRDVGPRGEYESILQSRLFGKAGRQKDVEAPPPPPPPEPEEEITVTRLDLVLHGTAATHPTDPLASAIIEDRSNRQTGTYLVGEELRDDVKLLEVYPRQVLIQNGQKKEVLCMDDLDEGEATSMMAGRTTPDPRSRTASNRYVGGQSSASSDQARYTINKNEFVQQLYVNYADLVTKVRPQLYVDDSGKVAGITASNIEDIPLAKTLDLKDGDVLQSINNETVDSQEKIIKLVNKFRNTTTFKVQLLRNGQSLVRTYKLD